jgi:T5SS/PEP-CTERM-associated repeat protein
VRPASGTHALLSGGIRRFDFAARHGNAKFSQREVIMRRIATDSTIISHIAQLVFVFTEMKRAWQAVVVGLLQTLFITPALAIDLYWDNAGAGLSAFNNANYWSLDAGLTMPAGAAPAAPDNAFFGFDANYSVVLGVSAANNVTISDGVVEFVDAGGSVLNNGGVVTIDDPFAAGLGDGARVTLASAAWTSAGDVLVGSAGFGSLTLNSGADLTGRRILIGNASGAEGEVTLTGPGTTLTASLLSNEGVHVIGNNGGTGTMHILAGAQLRTQSTGGNDIWVGSGTDGGDPAIASTGTLNIDGAGSFAETEDLIMGIFGGVGFLNITGGAQVINTDGGANGSPDTIFANDAGSEGTGVVDGDGSLLRSRSILVGSAGIGRLTVSGGGVARTLAQGTSVGDMFIGLTNGSDGKAAVYGTATDGTTPSLLDVDNSLFVGDTGLGVLHVGQDLDGNAVGSGALQVDVNLRIGVNAANTADNKVVLDGANVTATVGDVVFAGENGRGTLELRNGATLTAARPRVGSGPVANGTLLVTGDGTLFTATVDTVVGTSGTGAATVSDGATFTNDVLWIGYQGASNGTLIIDDATVNAGADNVGILYVGGRTDGAGGTGSVTVQNGGLLTAGGLTIIGGNATATGTLTVTGPGSHLDNSDNAPNGAPDDTLRVGQNSGAAFLNVLDGGRLDTEAVWTGLGGGTNAAEVFVDGAGSTFNVDNFLRIGDGRGSIFTVSNGGTLNVAVSAQAGVSNNQLIVGYLAGGDGAILTVTGAGSLVDFFGNERISAGLSGGEINNRATINVLAGGRLNAVQRDGGGAVLSSGFLMVGDETGSHGQVTVDGAGSRVEVRYMQVGDGTTNSSGIVDITGGGLITTLEHVEAGSNGAGVGTINVTGLGSRLEVGSYLSLGDDIPGDGPATGNLNVSAGGNVTNGGQAYIGHFTGSFGIATLGSATADVSTWIIGGELTLAGTEASSQTSGFGVLNVNTGGRVVVASNLRIRNLGDVNLNGGQIDVGDALVFTDAGSTFNFTSGTLRFTNAAGYTLSAAQLAGILGANPTLTAGKHLAVNGTAVLSAPLRLNGGAFSVGAISAGNLANLDFDAGTFNLTNANLTVGAGGIFGATLLIQADQSVNVTNLATVNAGAELVVAGEFSSGQLTNNGDVVAIDATIGGPVVNNNNVTVVGTVDFNGLVSGPGNFFGPGTANFNGGMAPGASPAEVTFEGSVALSDTNTLFIEIAGSTPGDDYDTLSVAGSAELDGLLHVSLDGFTPAIGQQFTVLTAGSITDHGLLLGGPAANSFSMMIDDTNVILQAIAPLLLGDYNEDGAVNAADYTVYRNRLAGIGGTTLPNDAGAPGVTIDDYSYWKAHYGEMLGAGSSLFDRTANVPEPASLVLACLACCALWKMTGRRNRTNRATTLSCTQ